MANFSLQIILPIASGTTPDVGYTAISANHRIFWAYPGIQYSIRASVVGGVWPYTFSLENAPSGMTIDASTGVVTWTASGNGTSSGTITLRVIDAESTNATSTWAIAVDQTRFVFFNASAGSDGTGTLASPYNTLSHLTNGDVANTKICYFRSGATPYSLVNLAHNNVGTKGYFRYVNFNSASYSTQWLAYPGETPVWDLGKALEAVATADIDVGTSQFTTGYYGDIWTTGDAVRVTSRNAADTANGTVPAPLDTATTYYIIRVDATHVKLASSYANALAGTAITLTDAGTASCWVTLGQPYIHFQNGLAYFEGFRVQNVPNKGINLVNDLKYVVIRNCTFYNGRGAGNSYNSAFIQTEGNQVNEYDAVNFPQIEFASYQNNTFDTYANGCALKVYRHHKFVIEDNVITTITKGTVFPLNACEGLAIKGGLMDYATVRFNVIHDVDEYALAGNHHTLRYAEYYHNLVYNCTSYGVYLNNFGTIITPIYMFRNTFLVPIVVRDGVDESLTGLIDSQAGPFTFTSNVIVNSSYSGTALSSITYDSVERGGTITMTTNLQGVSADNITDSVGKLVGTYRTNYLGSRGYEVASTPTALAFFLR